MEMMIEEEEVEIEIQGGVVELLMIQSIIVQ
jgi:hypothetical protein